MSRNNNVVEQSQSQSMPQKGGDSSKTHLAHRKLKTNLSRQDSKEIEKDTVEEDRHNDQQLLSYIEQKRQIAAQLQR